MTKLLDIKNLRKEYTNKEKNLEVLNIPSISIEKGQQIALIGHSGSGKTTLLNIIAGFNVPTGGEVKINCQDIYSLNESQRDLFRVSNIGYIFQNFNLIYSLTALENVLLPMFFVSNMAKKKQIDVAKELLEKVKLGDRLHHQPSKLSKGEQQRVAVARAMSNNANIILADEPTGNLDLHTGKMILSMIKEICQENNSALLLVTHNPYVVETFTEVWSMENINQASVIIKDRGK